MAELTPEQRGALTNLRRLNGVGRLTNDMLDDIVDKVGAARMWAAIDRHTAPKPNGSMNGSGVHTAA
jgi:hypothetical protein